MAQALSSNVLSSGYMTYGFKGPMFQDGEFIHWPTGGYGFVHAPHCEFDPTCTVASGYADSVPMWVTMWFKPGTTGATADSVVARAVKPLGEKVVQSHAIALSVSPSGTSYKQSRDWPLATWACIRSHIRGVGSTNLKITTWLGDRKIVDVSGIDGTKIRLSALNNFDFNTFSDRNEDATDPSQNLVGIVKPTSETAYWYYDNVHIRAGEPVSCEEIGFGRGGVPTSPSTPTGTRVIPAPPIVYE
jgi:hypothetical protein